MTVDLRTDVSISERLFSLSLSLSLSFFLCSCANFVTKTHYRWRSARNLQVAVHFRFSATEWPYVRAGAETNRLIFARPPLHAGDGRR